MPTSYTKASVREFIDRAAKNETQHADLLALTKMLTRVSGEKPKMWGPTIIGFGTYHYKYESGREGDACRIGFAPRGAQIVLYLSDEMPGRAALLKRIAPVKLGVACVYIKSLALSDVAAIEEMSRASLAIMDKKNPDNAKKRA